MRQSLRLYGKCEDHFLNSLNSIIITVLLKITEHKRSNAEYQIIIIIKHVLSSRVRLGIRIKVTVRVF